MTHQRTRIQVLGSGPAAEKWAAALSQTAAVSLVPEEASEIDALVVAPGATDAFGATKRALAAGRPVLFAASFSLSPWQAALLDALSRRTGAPLRIAEPFQHHGSLHFLQRLTRGSEPIWPLRYLRTTSIAPFAARIDELAIEDLATCQALIDLPPRTVTATAAQRDETGGISAVFLAVTYPKDVVVQCSISVVEPVATRQLIAVTRTRTVSIDRLNWAAPLEVAATAREAAAPLRRSITIASCDPVAEEALRFVQTVAGRGSSLGNSERWVWVAALWWAARQSMSFGGAIEVLAPKVLLSPSNTEPPPLRVIEGGGRGTRTTTRPQLTLIAS